VPCARSTVQRGKAKKRLQATRIKESPEATVPGRKESLAAATAAAAARSVFVVAAQAWLLLLLRAPLGLPV